MFRILSSFPSALGGCTIFIFFATVFAANPAYAEASDSLNAIVKKCARYGLSRPDSCLMFAFDGLRMAKAENDTLSLATLYLALGNSHILKGEYKRSLVYYDSCKAVMNRVDDDRLHASTYGNSAIAYWYLGDYAGAIRGHEGSLEIFKKTNNKKGIANGYGNIGLVYDRLGNYSMAIEYQIQALKIREEIQDTSGMANSFSNIGLLNQYMENYAEAIRYLNQSKKLDDGNNVNNAANTITNLGYTYYLMGRLDSAEYYQKLALSMRQQAGIKAGIAACLHRLSLIDLKKGNVASAQYRGEKALALQREVGDKANEMASLASLAGILTARGNYVQAESYAKRALTLSDSLNALKHQSDALTALVELYRKQGRLMDALKQQDALLVVRDSLRSEERIRQVTSMNIKYESEKKQQTINMLEQRADIQALGLKQAAWQRNGIIGGLVFTLLLLGVLYSRYRVKQKSNAQKELLLKEIHHRVKNNLQIISSLLNLQSRNSDDKKLQDAMKQGQSRVKSMALIHQKLYQTENISAIHFSTYIQELLEYLADVYQGTARKVKYQVESGDIKLGIDTAIPLGLILNELLSNSFKYAFPENTEGELHVELKPLEPNSYRLVVRDNGTGLPEDFDPTQATSVGLRLVNSLSRQLHGVPTFGAGQGFSFILDFKTV